MLGEEIRWAAQQVLFDPRRLRYLIAGGAGDLLALRRFFVAILPPARRSLAEIAQMAGRIPDRTLRDQALQTLNQKAYHLAGAGVLAAFLPPMARDHYLEIVAPLESIYDFLDTVCDRNAIGEPASRQLHEALFDALDPARPMREYFAGPAAGDDGDYLAALVRRTRRALSRLGSYELLVPFFMQAAQRYSDTQTFKHLPEHLRSAASKSWSEEARDARGLFWWEYCAAAGSQFHVYGALYAAFCSEFESIERTYDAYFPEFAAVHVLLDSFIDQAEDSEHRELNWVACYHSAAEFRERMRLLAGRAREALQTLPSPGAHRFALRLMVLFYLSHPKIAQQGLGHDAAALLDALSEST